MTTVPGAACESVNHVSISADRFLEHDGAGADPTAAESKNHFEAFDKAMAIHRQRDDALIASLRKLWGPQ